VRSDTALVTLLTDEASAVAARTIRGNALGLLESGEGGSLVLRNVTKDKDVAVGDLVATSGSRSEQLPSLFPRGIPIGLVTSVSQSDTEPFKQVQVQATADLSNLDVVTVLVR
jgi:rod shape-determining protein MreC